ncbi:MAG: hypothetical protein JJU20_12165 [Opitutales bacterium]|nr:hypothetical protein [Opitutales bacterium]
MNLNKEQKAAVAGWIQEGMNLSDVQKRIQSEFGVLLTYMDVRFLVDDLELELSDEPPAHFAKQKSSEINAKPDASAAKANPAAGTPVGADEAELVDEGPSGGSGSVTVSLDKIAVPGALVSGSVTFSDGISATWQLDQMGRLALNASQPGYKPSQQDVMQFQVELQRLVEERGGF